MDHHLFNHGWCPVHIATHGRHREPIPLVLTDGDFLYVNRRLASQKEDSRMYFIMRKYHDDFLGVHYSRHGRPIKSLERAQKTLEQDKYPSGSYIEGYGQGVVQVKGFNIQPQVR